MQKLITSEMSRNNKNINNFFGVDNTSLDYVLASLVTKMDYTIQKQAETIQKQAETDKKITGLTIDIQDLGVKNTAQIELIRDEIETSKQDIKKDINQKIEESDTNTNKRFTSMQCEITALKNQDGQKAMDILKGIAGIIIAVITAIAIAFSMKIVKLGDEPLDLKTAYCILPTCLPNTQSSLETL